MPSATAKFGSCGTKPAARVRTVNTEHQRILQAVLGRDQRKATQLMDTHLPETERAVSAILQDTAAASTVRSKP